MTIHRMRRRRGARWRSATLAAALTISCGGSTSVSTDFDSSVLDGYRFVASKAVASEDGGAVFFGAGGGLLPLQHALPPAAAPLTPTSPGVVTDGMVIDLASSDGHLYAATWKNGLAIVRRDNDAIVYQDPKGGTAGAWSVAVLDADPAICPSTRIVIVGTQDPDGGEPAPGPTGGRVLILAHDTADDSVALVHALEIGASIHVVAASFAIAPPPTLGGGGSFSVLIGTDCARYGNAPASLQRRDFSYRCVNGALELVDDAVLAWPGVLGATPSIVRDIAIDETTSRAYAAAYFDGVRAFDVAPGVLVEDASPGWPLRTLDAGGASFQTGFANCVVLDPDPEPATGFGTRLIVGWGQWFQGEWQYFGESSKIECAPDPTDVSANKCEGVWSYRLDALDDPVLGANGVVAEYALDPPLPGELRAVHALDVRRISPTVYYVDVAADTAGCATIRAERINGTWIASIEAWWSGDAPGNLPLRSHDDLALLRFAGGDDHLFVATEEGIATFDLGPADALASPACTDAAGGGTQVPCGEYANAVTLAGFGGASPRIFAASVRGSSGNPGGLRVYDVSDPTQPVALGNELDKDGRGFGIATVAGLHVGPVPPADDRARYVVTTQTQNGAPDGSSTVKVWGFGTANAPSDPGCTGCTPPALLATWIDPSDEDVLEGVAAIGVVPGQELALYVPYGVNEESQQSINSGKAGIVVLRVSIDGAGQLHVVKRQKTIDFSGKGRTFVPGRIVVDPDAQRVYACWGTGGIAMYDISSPYDPVTLSTRDFTGEFGAYNMPRSPVDVVAGPSACGKRFLYVAFVNDGVGVIDAKDHLHGSIEFVPVRGQALSIQLDPDDPAGETIFVAQGRAGVDKLRIDLCAD